MKPRLLAHLSDLHVGRNARGARDLEALDGMLRAAAVDFVAVSGDVTHRGLRSEWETFRSVFRAWEQAGRLAVVPGNHDCLGENIGSAIMPDGRVDTIVRDGLFVVRLNSNGPHNRRWMNAHGWMGADDIDAVSAAMDGAPPGAVVVLVLHHHPLPLPEDHRSERLMAWMGWPFTSELMLGRDLLAAIRGRCDLVLHGHRHRPGVTPLFGEDQRPLTIVNAGSSTDLKAFRCFSFAGNGQIAHARWIRPQAQPGNRHPHPATETNFGDNGLAVIT